MRRSHLVLLVTLASLGLFAVRSYSQPSGNLSDFMRVKLKHSQNVLEGLTTEDFDMIAKNAQDISLLSQAAEWQVLQTEAYAARSAEFRRTADELTRAAQEKNLDEATLKYLDLTMKCVDCHKYLRGVRLAGFERTIGPVSLLRTP